MITHFEIGNFKAFGDIQRIQLSDINLIFGANSAGKSTLMQAFAYLDEALRTLTWDVHSTRMGGKFMDLGGRMNLVHKHDPNRIIHFGITASGFKIVSPKHMIQALGLTKEVINACSHDFIKAGLPSIYFDVTYTFRIGINQNTDYPIEYLEIIENNSRLVGAGLNPSMGIETPERIVLKLKRDGEQYRVEDIDVDTLFFNRVTLLKEARLFDNVSLQDILTMEYPDPVIINDMFKSFLIDSDYDQFIGFWMSSEMDDLITNQFSNVIDKIEWQKRLLGYSINSIQAFFGLGKQFVEVDYPFKESTRIDSILRNSSHLGYVRPTPERLFTLFSSDGTLYSTLIQSKGTLDGINNMFRELGFGIEIRKAVYTNTSSNAKRTLDLLELYDLRRKTEVSFRDVGQGLIQILPVLFALSSSTSILDSSKHFQFIEQPELHLHPSMESELGKLLVRIQDTSQPKSADLELSFPYHLNKHLVIETHSEHLIKAIQLEVARFTSTRGAKGLNPRKLCIHYVAWDQANSQSIIRTLKLDEFGSFTEPWPDDFFDSGADLTMERLRMMNKN